MTNQLNPSQQKAVLASGRATAIIAGPGTGKTKTLTARIVHLVQSGVNPATLVALTFTKKAATEMRTRLVASGNYGDVTICTFHALCFDLIKQKTGQPPAFIDEPARLALIKQLAKSTKLKGYAVRDLSLLLSRAKNMAEHDIAVQPLLDAYNRELTNRGLLDFDDLLVRVRDLLQQDPAWRSMVQSRYRHILVDEFQDTNALQYGILRVLSAHADVFVIGDPQQSIYGFRGADGDIFSRFLQDFKNAATITLTVNYRSAQAVVELSNAIYPQAAKLTAYSPVPGKVQAVQVLNEYSEANWVLAQIQQAIGGSDLLRAVSDDTRDAHRSLADFAVLYRSRSAARAVQKAFDQSGIPYQVVGEGTPYEQPNVQLVLAVFKKVIDPACPVVIKGVSDRQLQSLAMALDPAGRPHALAEQVITACGLKPDADTQQLLSVLFRFTTVAEAVTYVNQIAAQEFYDPAADAVTLLTIHASKGLEFDRVFLIAAEEGILPSTKGDLAEEKRLFYVAATRAKTQLDILHAKHRTGKNAMISQFVAQIQSPILAHITDAHLKKDQQTLQKRRAKQAQARLL